MSSPKSPNLLEPLLNKTDEVSLIVVKFVIVKFVIVALFNCVEELIIPVPPKTCIEPETIPVGNCAELLTIPVGNCAEELIVPSGIVDATKVLILILKEPLSALY